MGAHIQGRQGMFHRTLTVFGAVLLAACAQALAIDSPPLDAATSASEASARELLDKLAGRWVLTGDIAGQSTVHDVDAGWSLQNNYVRISETSRELGDNGLPIYEATIFIGWLKDRYVCVWLDNTEVASGDITCSGATAPDSIPFEFRDREGTLIFTNTFSYERNDDTWEWRMANIRDGKAETFGIVSLRRK
jgi:hypothetical protein